ncbi:hypothetical protein CPB85DRAFT_1335819 [Mucidula mucida]|nr:hypothetical protein CPB85DRAFT_1335819 [Mucidula mucida]
MLSICTRWWETALTLLLGHGHSSSPTCTPDPSLVKTKTPFVWRPAHSYNRGPCFKPSMGQQQFFLHPFHFSTAGRQGCLAVHELTSFLV